MLRSNTHDTSDHVDHPTDIADHGNAEYARHPDGSPHTAHTNNPVPVVVLSEYVHSIHDGILADVAPTVLKLMGIPQPREMTGTALH